MTFLINHVFDANIAASKHDRIRLSGDREHDSEANAECAWHEEISWVDVDFVRLHSFV